MMIEGSCPVCLNVHKTEQATLVEANVGPRGMRVDCPVCGQFELTTDALVDYLAPDSPRGQSLTTPQRATLSHLLLTSAETGQSGLPRLKATTIQHFLDDGFPIKAPPDQARNAILVIGKHVMESGERLPCLPDNFYAMIGSPSHQVAIDLVTDLIAAGSVIGESMHVYSGGEVILHLTLTLSGWEKYAEAARGHGPAKDGFMAMKFNDPELELFVSTVLKPVLREKIGMNLYDARDLVKAGIIDNIMRAQIRDSAFVLVDLTHDNSGAYWEAGYAEGLGKPVIYLCEKTKFESAQTHFDTNHCATILWSRDSFEASGLELVATLRRSLEMHFV